MDRRKYLSYSGIALAGVALGGCLNDSNDAPPPRKSDVIEEVSLAEDGSALVVRLVPQGDRWVMSRRDIDQKGGVEQTANSITTLSLVGTARAAKGRGTTSRSSTSHSSAPKTSKGRAWYGGGGYVGGWYGNHDDEVSEYSVDIDELGVEYIGDNDTFEEQDPGPGPVSWDETYDDVSGSIETTVQDARRGWYRIGANVVVPSSDSGDGDLGWECLDIRVESRPDGKEITERWKVSPRI